MLIPVNSYLIGKCFRNRVRGRLGGAYVVTHYFRRSETQTRFLIVRDLQTNKHRIVCKTSMLRALSNKRLMIGYTWFICGRCYGSGKNKYSDDCPRCDGIPTIWIDVGYTKDDLLNYRLRRRKRKDRIITPRFLLPKQNTSKSAKQTTKK